ncbi:ATP-grasp domain containing protein [Novymonas esmeraldas]|uniref:ATP-grasp domain containing protein n=1 Tax=Novymonas esmeraldas TaxID=1808958 RepID=A0AAW0EUA6_9TRYP
MDGKVVVFLRVSSVARIPLYHHLRSLGVTLVLVHPHTPLSEFDGIFHHWLRQETDDVEEVYRTVSAFLASRGLTASAVVSFDEYAVYQAAAVAARLDLVPVPLPPAAIQQNNLKDSFRRFCQEHDISSPKSVPLSAAAALLPTPATMAALARDPEGLAAAFESVRPALVVSLASAMAAAAVEFPIVLKPSPGAGSLLARWCPTAEDAVSHVWRMWIALANHPDTRYFAAVARGAPAGGVGGTAAETSANPVHILAEEYIEGQEVDMDCIVEHGVVRFCAVSDNFAPSPPYFAEVGGLCPSALDVEAQEALRDLLESYVRAQGTRLHGVLHFEAKYDPARRRAYVIEVNCRPGSAETYTMLHTVYREVNLGEALVRCALQLPIRDQLARHFPESFTGEPEALLLNRAATAALCVPDADVAAPPTMWSMLGGPSRGFFPSQCWAASVNLYPAVAGVLRKARVPVEDDSLVAYSVSARPGEAVAPPPTRFYLLCWMVARGKTAAEALDNIHRLTSAFEQEVAP